MSDKNLNMRDETESLMIGDTIREIRLLRGLTQDDVAIACGLKRLSISQMETDRRGVSPRILTRLALSLSVPVSIFHLLADASEDPLVKQFQRVARKSLGLSSVRKSAMTADRK